MDKKAMLVPYFEIEVLYLKKKDICKLSNRICFRQYQCVNCQVKETRNLGFEWLDEWKITDIWNVLGWKEVL